LLNTSGWWLLLWLSLVIAALWLAEQVGVKGHWFRLWHTFRGADVARVASGIGVIWVIMVGM